MGDPLIALQIVSLHIFIGPMKMKNPRVKAGSPEPILLSHKFFCPFPWNAVVLLKEHPCQIKFA
jgi:hypothetical protein